MQLIQLIKKYKILHVIFWTQSWYSLVHTLMQFSREKNYFIIYHNSTFTIIFQMIMVYFIVYFILPKFFYNKKYLRFVFFCLVTILLSCLFELFLKEKSIQLFYNPNYHLNYRIVIIGNIIDSTKLSLIFIIIYLVEYYYLKDKRNITLEKQKLQTELDFLKSQINPHFLFNALNSLHVIIREDTVLAEKTLLEFSSLLRYQLYDCNNSFTTLDKELQFVSDYIAIEKLRYGDELQVNFSCPPKINYKELAPFLFIPFVENAFKHVSRYNSKSNYIFIDVSYESEILIFIVENSLDNGTKNNANDITRKGIGLDNVKRRLELIYPKKHNLQIQSDQQKFSIKLEIWS